MKPEDGDFIPPGATKMCDKYGIIAALLTAVAWLAGGWRG